MAMYMHLQREEETALARLAYRERRTPRDQAAILLRQALIDAGALLSDGTLPHDSVLDGDCDTSASV